ncbi:MAG: hypothetical protein AB1424_14485, partial [Thermodesulfobacteriota bacterium]
YENRTCSQANLSRKKTPPGEFFSNDVYRLSCNFLTGQCWGEPRVRPLAKGEYQIRPDNRLPAATSVALAGQLCKEPLPVLKSLL